VKKWTFIVMVTVVVALGDIDGQPRVGVPRWVISISSKTARSQNLCEDGMVLWSDNGRWQQNYTAFTQGWFWLISHPTTNHMVRMFSCYQPRGGAECCGDAIACASTFQQINLLSGGGYVEDTPDWGSPPYYRQYNSNPPRYMSVTRALDSRSPMRPWWR
jgi:hypothetical protein